eukprot:9295708-Ditylum_brightwellii.AAC.1
MGFAKEVDFDKDLVEGSGGVKLGHDNLQAEYDYTVIGKGGIPFNVKTSQLKKRLLPDVAEIPLNDKECSLLAK